MPAQSFWRVLNADDDANVITLNARFETTHILIIEEPMVRVRRLQLNDDGSCSMLSVDSLVDHTCSVFDPPLALCPKQLMSTDPFESHSLMQVRGDNGNERDRGSSVHTIAILGSSRITTELGTFDCVVVRSHVRSEMKYATLDRTVTTWLAHDQGPVAEETAENIAVMGIFSKQTDRRIVKISQP